jgi:putative transposase
VPSPSRIRVTEPYPKGGTMAKKKSMTVEEALQVILASEGDNPLRMMLEYMVQASLEAEMTEHLAAKPYERSETRTGYRNGQKPRIFTTAVGDLYLMVPQDRDGTFSPTLFARYQRSDKALVLALMEMYVQGVSTRKVAAVTEKLCGRSFSSQLVSKLAGDLDEKLALWRGRPIEGDHPYIIVDARYEKVREAGRVTSMGVLIAMGVNSEGKRTILSVEVADTENAGTWSELFRRLKGRGLSGVRLVTSDDHKGIKAAVVRFFQGASWQRCQCHFIKNMIDMVGKADKAALHADLRSVFDAADLAAVSWRMEELMGRWTCKREDVADKIEEGIEDCLACLHFPGSHAKRIRTTNTLERFNQELKRRTRVARIFPNRDSVLRLVSALAMEQSEEWETGRRYLDVSLLAEEEGGVEQEGSGDVVCLEPSAALA